MAVADPLTLSPDRSPQAAELLRDHEARGLLWSMGARSALIGVGLFFTFVNSHSIVDVAYTVALCVVAVGLMVYCHGLIRRRERHLFVGRLLMGFDLVVIAAMPWIWYSSVGGSQVNAAFLIKNDLVLVVMLFQAINALALRPLYPMTITYWALLTMFAASLYALNDPRLMITDDNLEEVLGAGVKIGFFGWRVATVFLVGFFLTRMAGWARATIVEVVELEDTNRTIMEEQSRAVFDAKMDALGNLVAGIAHELNTPLGAMLGAADTSQRSAEKLLDTLRRDPRAGEVADDPQLQRLLSVLERNDGVVRDAGARMTELVDSLKQFASLDEAELQPTDLRQSLDRVWSLMSDRLRGEVAVARDYEEVPTVVCRSQAITQVLLTIVVNALEAMDGEGTLTLAARSNGKGVVLEIADTGPGMARDQVDRLFDLGFAAKQGRVGFGLGLPAARDTLRNHGGDLSVHSERGKGTRFIISLPAAPTH